MVTVCEVSLLQNTACNQRTLRGDMACCKKCYQAILFYLKGKVHSKRKPLSSFTHPCVFPKRIFFFFNGKYLNKGLKKKKKAVCPYNVWFPMFLKCMFHRRKKIKRIHKFRTLFFMNYPFKKSIGSRSHTTKLDFWLAPEVIATMSDFLKMK